MNECTGYPELASTSTPNPYPVVPNADSPAESAFESFENANSPSSASIDSEDSNVGTGFANHAEYLTLGEKALQNLNRLAHSSTEARRWQPFIPAPQTPPPVTSPSAVTPFSLPGVHVLPESDVLSRPVDMVEGRSEQRHASESPTFRNISPAPPRGRRGPGRPRGSGRGGWRHALQGTAHAELFKKPIVPRESGRRRGVPNKKSGRRTQQPDPGPRYKALQSQATQYFMEGDLENAKEHALAALQANPEVFSSYLLLSEIYQQQGLERESIHMLASGAPVQKDPEVWAGVASKILAAAGDDKTEDEMNFALKCYDEAIKLKNNDFGTRTSRLELYCELKLWQKARRECGTLLAMQPNNLDMLWKYAMLCHQSGNNADVHGAIDSYERAFHHCRHQTSFGTPEVQWDHLNLYLDLVSVIGPPDRGIGMLKRIARWFLGRQSETFWDGVYYDDREFDEDRQRRMQIPQVQTGHASQDDARYGLGLPIEIRVKLGLFRLQMGQAQYSEAIRHFDCLRRTKELADVEDLADLFQEVGHALRHRSLFGAAFDFFDRLRPFSAAFDREYWMGLAQCCRETGRSSEAEEAYKRVIANYENEVQARVNLVMLYEADGQNLKALPIANELIEIGRADKLREFNMSTYIRASKRVKKKAQTDLNTKAVAADDAISESDSDTEDDAGGKKPQYHVGWRNPAKRPVRWNDITVQGASTGQSKEDDVGAVNAVKPMNFQWTSSSQDITFVRGAEYLKSLRQQKTRITGHYKKVMALWPQVDADDDPTVCRRWMQHADAMAQDFRLIKEFYPRRQRDKVYTGLRTGVDVASRTLVSEMEAMKKKLLADAVRVGTNNNTVPLASSANAQFHEISFAEWHKIFSTLALLAAKFSQQEQCYDILQKVLLPANVFTDDPELLNASFALCLCCALMFNDVDFVLWTSKKLTAAYDATIATQIVAAAGRFGHGESGFHSRMTSSFLSYHVEEQDYLAMPAEKRDKLDWGKHTHSLVGAAKSVEKRDHPAELETLTALAHIKRKAISIPYLYRALALDPENLVVHLSLASAYLLHSGRKLADARNFEGIHYESSLGMAFLHRYYDLRVASGKACHVQEAEFNMARVWQLLEMVPAAITGYEKVLGLSGRVQHENEEEGRVDGEDFAREAAFALQGIYVAAGNEAAARAITEKWLVM